MRLLMLSAMLLTETAFCGIKNASDNGIQARNGDRSKATCVICSLGLGNNLALKDPLYLVACPRVARHIFHAKCFAEAPINKHKSAKTCPICCEDCKPIMRRILTTHQDNSTMRKEMLAFISRLPKEELSCIFDLNFIHSEYECLTKVLAETQFAEMHGFVSGLIANASNTIDFYKYLASEHTGRISAILYRTVLAKCLANKISEMQIIIMFVNLLRTAYHDEAEKRANIAAFISVVIESPYIRLSDDDVCVLVIGAMENEAYDSARFILANIKMRHALCADRVFRILRCCLDIQNPNGVSMFVHTWFNMVYLNKFCSSKIMEIKKRVDEHLSKKSPAESRPIRITVEKTYRLMAIPQPYHSQTIINTILEAARTYDNGNGKRLLPACLIKSGALGMIVTLSRKECKLLFQELLINLDIGFTKAVYFRLPESMTNVEMDLAILQRLISTSAYSHKELYYYIMAITRRHYFNYEIFMRVLNILSWIGTENAEQSYIWLLLVAKHQGFFDSLNCKYNALFNKLVQANFSWGAALIEKPIYKNAARESIIIKNAHAIILMSCKVSAGIREYIARQYSDSYLVAIWCQYITHLVMLLAKNATADNDMLSLCFFIKSICGTAYFASSVSCTQVMTFIRQLLSWKSSSLICIDAFLMAARSELHVQVAKTELFKALVSQQLSINDIGTMNAMGLNLCLTTMGLFYRTKNDSMKILVPAMIDDVVAEMIKNVDKNQLLMLVREKFEAN